MADERAEIKPADTPLERFNSSITPLCQAWVDADQKASSANYRESGDFRAQRSSLYRMITGLTADTLVHSSAEVRPLIVDTALYRLGKSRNAQKQDFTDIDGLKFVKDTLLRVLKLTTKTAQTPKPVEQLMDDLHLPREQQFDFQDGLIDTMRPEDVLDLYTPNPRIQGVNTENISPQDS
jgi:hypothetical protein